MRATEFVTESVTSPYNMNFRNSVTWARKGSRRTKGVAADFTTDSGVKYMVRAMHIAPTKAERDAAQPKSAFSNDIMLPPTMDSRFGGMWEVHFDSYDEADKDDERSGYKNKLTGQGDEFRVFATIISLLERMIGEYHPEIISIKSDNTEPKRFTLYSRLAKRFAPQLGYEIVKTVATDSTTRMELRKVDK